MTLASKALFFMLVMTFIKEDECSPPGYTQHCRCSYKHPQPMLCEADFIGKVKILKKMDLHEFEDKSDPWSLSYYSIKDGKTVYVRDTFHVKILRTYKRKPEFTDKKVKLLVFPVEDFDYGCPPTEFSERTGVVYVVGGKETESGVKMDGCDDFHKTWSTLTRVQKKLLGNRKYINNCNCKICYEMRYYLGSYYDPSYDDLQNKTCREAKDTCIYNMNEEKDWDPMPLGTTYHNIGGCYQGNAFCKYSEKKEQCRWKFHRKTDAEKCEEKLNAQNN